MNRNPRGIARATGAVPVGERKRGGKRHVVTDTQGVPLAEHATATDKQATPCRLKGV